MLEVILSCAFRHIVMNKAAAYNLFPISRQRRVFPAHKRVQNDSTKMFNRSDRSGTLAGCVPIFRKHIITRSYYQSLEFILQFMVFNWMVMRVHIAL